MSSLVLQPGLGVSTSVLFTERFLCVLLGLGIGLGLHFQTEMLFQVQQNTKY